jgi:hypothetical protein
MAKIHKAHARLTTWLPFVGASMAGPYLAIIRYLIQRPDLIGCFDALAPRHSSNHGKGNWDMTDWREKNGGVAE